MRIQLALTLLAVSAPAQEPCTILTTIESVRQDGNDANNSSFDPTFSADGRYFVFASYASNLVPADSNGAIDIFLRDLELGLMQRVSLSYEFWQGNGGSLEPRIAADASCVVFSSAASNMVPGDTNSEQDIFVRDLTTHTTELISVDSSGNQGDKRSHYPDVSADGRFVAFESDATNLVPGDTNDRTDVFLRDRLAGTTIRASVGWAGNQLSRDSFSAQVTSDGQTVFFVTRAANVVLGDPNDTRDIFAYDVATGSVEVVSLADDGSWSNGSSTNPTPSADGRYVAFMSGATNLTHDSAGPAQNHAYVRDRLTGRTTLQSRGPWGAANHSTYNCTISDDGSTVAFTTWADGLVPGDTNGLLDVYLRSLDLGKTCLLSVAPDGNPGDLPSQDTFLGVDGSRAAFRSVASNLVSNDGPHEDVFLSQTRIGPGRVVCAGDLTFGDCPCGNPGTRGEGCATSTGRGARLEVGGSAFLVNDDLTLTVRDLPPNQPALLFAGSAGSPQLFGDGITCVTGPITRISAQQGGSLGTATWIGNLSAAGAAFGTPVSFQAWFRDPLSPCGNGYNLTQAIEFLPAL